MWIFFGLLAIITAILNVSCIFTKKDPKWFRYISLASTALTVCDFYSGAAAWVRAEDWSALLDVTAYLATPLWTLTILSIIINGITLFEVLKKRKPSV